jgi:Glyoxalase-like domain
MAKGIQVVFDCANPAELSAFWAEALGYTIQPPPDGYTSWEDWLREHKIPEDQWDSASAIIDPEAKGPRIYFQRVPEQKTVKNRVHLDINVGERGMAADERRQRVDAEVDRLVAIGAKTVRPGDPEGREYYTVMQDPEGNEYCVQ